MTTPTRTATLAVLERFSAAFDARDIEAVMSCMTTDCLFESTRPPNGERFVGQTAVRRAWTDLFASSPGARFTTEEQFVFDDHAVALWRYDWSGNDPGYVRGIDVFVVRGDLVAEKRSYVKG